MVFPTMVGRQMADWQMANGLQHQSGMYNQQLLTIAIRMRKMDDSDSYRKIKDEGLEIRGQYLT